MCNATIFDFHNKTFPTITIKIRVLNKVKVSKVNIQNGNNF